MRARDIMTTNVRVVMHDDPVERAADLMTTHAITALPVLDAAGRLTGMVGESDLLWHRVPAEPDTDETGHPDTEPLHRPAVVLEVMSEFPVTTSPGADIADVAQLMLDHDVRSLPVVEEGGVVVGIISRRDILKAVVRTNDTVTADVQRRLDDYAGRRDLWTATAESGVVTVTGTFPNEQQRAVVTALARTVPGVAAVRLCPPAGAGGPNGTVAATGEVVA
ncbi:CBS domain-containing protein [Actinoplanes sp. NPDC023714]|uniref:CBS domain-containing protein n=1 Tax=Actinoplanes sp. NPDC023714 TaxID=3154322 RepID=UPI003406CB80